MPKKRKIKQKLLKRETNSMALLIILATVLYAVLKVVDALAIPVFIVFLVLKLCGVIAWSWLFVCLPLIVFAGAIILTILLAIMLNALS